jgi:hypothetical protein
LINDVFNLTRSVEGDIVVIPELSLFRINDEEIEVSSSTISFDKRLLRIRERKFNSPLTNKKSIYDV